MQGSLWRHEQLCQPFFLSAIMRCCMRLVRLLLEFTPLSIFWWSSSVQTSWHGHFCIPSDRHQACAPSRSDRRLSTHVWKPDRNEARSRPFPSTRRACLEWTSGGDSRHVAGSQQCLAAEKRIVRITQSMQSDRHHRPRIDPKGTSILPRSQWLHQWSTTATTMTTTAMAEDSPL